MAARKALTAVPSLALPNSALEIEKVRLDFPLLRRPPGKMPRIHFTNARTSLKPLPVLHAIVRYYEQENASQLRGARVVAEHAAESYLGARARVQSFLNAAEVDEIALLSGTTEGIRLVADSYGKAHIGEGDEVVVTAMEHRANLLPWKLLCQARGARLRVLPMNDDGELQVEEFERLLGPQTRLAVLAQVSNALGTVNPVRELIAVAHRAGVPVLVDGAQAAPHFSVDVRALDCDFYVFSGHKVYGPAGTGVLYRKLSRQENAPSFQHKEGTGVGLRAMQVAAAVGLAAALEYVSAIGREKIAAWEGELLRHAVAEIAAIPGFRVIGNARERAGLISFVAEGIDANDMAAALEGQGIAIHAGHHRAEPVMERFGILNTARVSFSMFNTREEVDTLIRSLRNI